MAFVLFNCLVNYLSFCIKKAPSSLGGGKKGVHAHTLHTAASTVAVAHGTHLLYLGGCYQYRMPWGYLYLLGF